MTRVLHVLHSFPPDSRGGVETYVAALARAQAEAGFEVGVLCPSEQGERPIEEIEGVVVRRLAWRDPVNQALGDRGASARTELRALLDVERIDLVHVHHWSGLGPIAVQTAAELGLARVVTMHDLFPLCPFSFRLRNDRTLCAPDVDLATCVQCVHETAGTPLEPTRTGMEWRSKSYLAELRDAHAVLGLSHAQVDYLRRVPALRDLAIESIGFPARSLDLTAAPTPRKIEGALRIVSWGGLVRGKGMHLLVEAAKQLPAGSVELHHHGPFIDLEYRDELVAAAGDLPLSLHGPFSPEELPGFAARYDLAVFPSQFLETYGYTTDEALEVGLPVIVTDRGAPKERIGARGIATPAGDANALARELLQFVERPERALEMRRGSIAPRQSPAEHLDALTRIYTRALAAAGLFSTNCH